MTTDTALMAQLRSAWNHAAVTIPIQAPIEPPTCLQHIDRSEWLDEPAKHRPGWIRTTCRCCGGFIGYRPENDTSRRK